MLKFLLLIIHLKKIMINDYLLVTGEKIIGLKK